MSSSDMDSRMAGSGILGVVDGPSAANAPAAPKYTGVDRARASLISTYAACLGVEAIHADVLETVSRIGSDEAGHMPPGAV
ncbi:MAG: hypothetical protein ACU0CI_13165, partial [Shimia sp.]